MGITTSLWFAERQGWLNPCARDYFATGATDYAFALAIIDFDKHQQQLDEKDERTEVSEP